MLALNRNTANVKENFAPKILQFGGGNFLRAFVDWMVDILNEETDFDGSVIVVKPTEGGDYKALRQQDGLFHVLLEGIQDGEEITEERLVRSITQVIHPYQSFDVFLATAKLDSLRFVVSNTTEAGIVFDPADRLEDKPPREFPAKLTRWLLERYRHFDGRADRGCILLPCELIEQNGEKLKAAISQYAAAWKLPEAFKQWLNRHNIFCNTLVDRIVSGYPAATAELLEKKLGYSDQLLVAGEYYHSWIIQGPETVKKELPFQETSLNVKFVDNLEPYRQIKVRILNGAHTAMVPVGYLAGLESVWQAISDPLIRPYIRHLILEEIVPTLDFPPAELMKFTNDVIDRFYNPAIFHRLIDIALNSTSKFKTRLLPSLLQYHQQTGKVPSRIAFALAALIRFYKGQHNGLAIPLQDNGETIEFFDQLWKKLENDPEKLVEQVLCNTSLWSKNLNEVEQLKEIVATYLQLIHREGVKAGLEHIENLK